MTRFRRVAVTGLSKAGKSVFLASLLQHLKYFNTKDFPIAPGGGDTIVLPGFKELPVKKGYFIHFPFDEILGKLTDPDGGGVLPDSTRDAGIFRFGITRRENWPRTWHSFVTSYFASTNYEFEFIDFPGERLADVAIFENAAFDGWSDAVHRFHRSYGHIFRHFKEYHALTMEMSRGDGRSTAGEDAAKLVSAYKSALTAMIMNGVQIVTPSSFWREFDTGKEFTRADAWNNGAGRPCGLSGRDFAPLPDVLREARPDIAALFTANYRAYRDAAVLPLFNAFRKCDNLLFLVDIPDILNSGVDKYDEIVHLLEKFGGSMRRTGWFGRNIGKVLFVATKSDMVSMAPEDQGNLKKLLDDLKDKMANTMPDSDFASFVVSAWVSTTRVSASPYLLNSMILAQEGKEDEGTSGDGDAPRVLRDVEYHVSKVPGSWSKEKGWKRGDYAFPEQALYPVRSKSAIPKQYHLEDVFRALL